MSTTTAIRAEGVAHAFGDVVALDGLDLEVEAGTVFGLLGPNGAGKTTLVRVLATLLRPTAGRARVLGHDVVAEPLAVRRRIGLAGQFAAVDGELTGRENLEMIGRLYRLSRAEARAGAPPRCSTASGSSRPPTGPSRRTRAACAAGSTSGRAWSAGRRCSCSTSPPPGSTRARARSCGPPSTSCAARARRSS